ncbi:hypothetical protein QJQ45_001759 [Haematococcus lacustris]|nr:hypothetical protein QJQ45_001759 [Haematococcus lacustris]
MCEEPDFMSNIVTNMRWLRGSETWRRPQSHPSQSQLQGSSQHHPALPALLHLPGLSILTRPATNPMTSPAVEQQPIIHTTVEQDKQTMPPSMPKQQQDWATARDDERTLVNETRRFFESSLLVMWLEFDNEQQHLEEQWRVEIMSEHWHAQQIGILVACAYFKNKEGAYYEQTVYVMTDGKDQSAAITQAAVNQVVCYLLAEHDMDMRQLYMWSDGCEGQFKGAPAMRQHWGMAQRFSVPVWWSYGATAHFKGRHDSEGGVMKQWLRGIQVEWSQTACACAQCMTPAPRGVCMKPTITKPFEAMPMFDQKRDDEHWDDEFLTLLCSFAPDSVMQLCTLGKKLSVKMLNEYCKAVGLHVPANTLRADLRYIVLEHLNEQAECD